MTLISGKIKDKSTTYAQSLVNVLNNTLPDKRPLPLHEPTFEGSEWQYVKECIDTGWVSSVGSYVDQFEADLREFTGSKYSVATVNGTCALVVALKAIGVKAGEEVLVPDLTFVATANAVSHLGAVPHFVDSTLETLGVDPVKLDQWLKEIGLETEQGLMNRKTNRLIKALIVMHTFGHPCQMDEIREVTQKYKVALVEDAAESIGSYYKDEHTGLFGDVATLSFNGNKTITTGGGGAILTQDESLAKNIKHLTTTAKQPHPWRFFHDQIGYNFRMPNINAALGCAQLEKLPDFIDKKRKLFQKFKEAFSKVDTVKLFEEPKDCKSNYWLHSLLLDEEHSSHLNDILDLANKEGIQIRPAWDLMHTLPMYKDNPKMPTETAIKLRKSVICLPSSPY